MLNVIVFLLDLVDRYTLWILVVCAVIILFHLRSYAVAHRARTNTLFTIEREVAAHREGKAMTSIGLVLGVAVVVIALKYYILPSVEVAELVKPTPTLGMVVPTRIPTPDAHARSDGLPPRPPFVLGLHCDVSSRRLRPAPRARSRRHAPTPTSASHSAHGCRGQGHVTFSGTATHDRFQFYKIEIGVGEEPSEWHSISDIKRAPVADGVLDDFDTRQVPDGVYWFKLTVVDQTGNFPPPCAVRVVVQNGG